MDSPHPHSTLSPDSSLPDVQPASQFHILHLKARHRTHILYLLQDLFDAHTDSDNLF